MNVTFHGAAGTVTGSRHLLSVGGSRVLLDCGLYQGSDDVMAAYNRRFPFDPASLDAVVLSHAHLDHCGMLPSLVRHGFEGRIWCTSATADLSRHIMLDSAHIQESDAAFDNKHRKGGEPLAEPLYTQDDATEAGTRFHPVGFGTAFEPAPGVTVNLFPAGHILGAAVVKLDLEEGGRKVRVGFSGDLGRYRIPLLEDPTPLADLDVLLLESTYGDRIHDSPEVAYERLYEVAKRCFEQRGKLLIPSFALGRAQELIYAFHRLFDAGRLPRVPVYLDSPLAARLTEVFRRHKHDFDAESRAFMAADAHASPLDFPEVHHVDAVQDSMALNNSEGPMVIVSPSGMLTGGRVRHHLRHTISDPKNTVLIVSWQAPGTLGRRLVEKAPTVRLFGDELPVRAQVEVINGFSAHADRDGLVQFARQIGPQLRRLALVHGEPASASALAAGFSPQGNTAITIPAQGDSLELDS